MNKAMVIVATLLFCVNAYAGEGNLKKLLAEVDKTTDTITIDGYGYAISASTPSTAEDIDLLVKAMGNKNKASAVGTASGAWGASGAVPAYCQMALARVKDPKLAPAIHKNLKEMTKTLKRTNKEEFKRLKPEEQNKNMVEAMNIAAIVHVLGELKYKEAIPDLRKLLDYDEEYQGYISMEASIALGKLGDEQTLDKLAKEASTNKPISLSGWGVRGIRKIVERVDEIEKDMKVNPSKNYKDKRPSEIVELTGKLSKMGKKDKETKAALRELLKHPNHEVNYEAAEALMWSLDSEDREITLEMLKHKNHIVRMSGIDALRLAKTWDKSFLPLLIDMMQNDPEYSVRRKIVETLRFLVGEGVRRKDMAPAVSYLEKLLKEESMCRTAFYALYRLTGKLYKCDCLNEVDKESIRLYMPDNQPENTEKVFK